MNHRLVLSSLITGLVLISMYFILILILSELEPGYSHIENTISELGGVDGPRKLFFQIGGIITGIGIIIFALGLHHGIDHGKGSKFGPVLIILSGIGLVGVSIFLHHNIGEDEFFDHFGTIRVLHLIFASIAVSTAGIAPIIMAFRFRKSKTWNKLSNISFFFGSISHIPSLVIFLGLVTSSMQHIQGILEKLSVLIPYVWLIIIAIKLLIHLIQMPTTDTYDNK